MADMTDSYLLLLYKNGFFFISDSSVIKYTLPGSSANNKDVDELNAMIQMDIGGQLLSYKSFDTVMDQDDIVNYPTEFFHHTIYS